LTALDRAHARLAELAALLAHPLDRPELTQCLEPCRLGIHAAVHEVAGFLFEVEAQLLVDIAGDVHPEEARVSPPGGDALHHARRNPGPVVAARMRETASV
jgi:hypothetical protein